MFLVYSIILSAFSSLFTPAQDLPDYKFLFEKIDNKAQIFIGDSLVYSSDTIELNPDLAIEVYIFDYDKRDGDLIVKVFNGGRADVAVLEDTHWEVRYELFKEGQSIDYVWEMSRDLEEKLGLVYEKSYSDL